MTQTEQDVETTDHRASVAAHLQGLGIGMAVGMGVMLATTNERAVYAVTAVGFLAVTAGYIVDKRRVQT